MAWRTQGEDGALPCNPPRQRGTREIGERISVRATDEGDGKPWGVLAGIGGVRAVWPPLHGEYCADRPSPLAGWGKTPWPVGRGRGGNGRSHHGPGGCAPVSETPGMCARDLQWDRTAPPCYPIDPTVARPADHGVGREGKAEAVSPRCTIVGSQTAP